MSRGNKVWTAGDLAPAGITRVRDGHGLFWVRHTGRSRFWHVEGSGTSTHRATWDYLVNNRSPIAGASVGTTEPRQEDSK